MGRWIATIGVIALFACDGTDGVKVSLFDTGTSVDGDALDSPPEVPVDGDDTGDSDEPVEKVTWHKDIRPLMGKHCTRCHYDAGLGVGDFEDPIVVSAMAEIMLSRIDSGVMPPPVSDPECREYKGADHLRMPPESRDVLASWIEDGKVLGDPEEAPDFEPISETLADADMVLRIPEPYVPLFADESNPGNEYRCFMIDMVLEEAIYITAMAPLVDQKSMVHHIVLFTKNVADIPAHEQGPEGYDCIDGGMADGVNGMIAGWAPGALPVEFPSGYGMRLGTDDRLIAQMHYFQSGPEMVGVADQTGYAFRTADSVERSVLMFPVGNFSFEIPAGEAAYKDTFEFELPPYLNFEILGTFPHMHLLGSGYRMWLNPKPPDDDEEDEAAEDVCLVESDQYDFDNQITYFFEDPVPVSGGDTLGFECTWDNSVDNPNQMYDVPRDIGYGERTDEEMCFAFTLIGL